MARKQPTIPMKTPLVPASAAKVKRLQLAIKAARDHVDTLRAPTSRESPHIINLIHSIGFVKARLEDGSEVALRFVGGLRHPDTGLAYYVTVDPAQAAAVQASPEADYRWRAEKDKKGGVIVRAQRTAETTTAARILYQLSSSGGALRKSVQVRVKDDGSGQRNAIDLRMSNLEVTDSPYAGNRRGVPDLTPYSERIAAILAETNDVEE